MNSGRSIGYYQLLKKNRPFRHLWYGQVVSELGDWLNSIAIYTLVLQISGTGTAMAAAMMAKLLPIFFVSPLAGVLIDRMDRKVIMIASDILRFIVVLGFLAVDGAEDLWLLYTLAVVEIALAGFFEPARSAIIPSITPREDLVTANALSGSTWSVMLAFGAAMGGVLVSLFGIKTAFVVDALTFLLSAWFVARIQYPPGWLAPGKPGEAPSSGFSALMEGLRYLISQPMVLMLAVLKSGLAMAGGVMTLIPLYANKMYTSAAAISMAIGTMYSARGLGAALGPILVKKFFGDSTRVLQISILCGFFLGACSYFLFSQSHSLWSASLSIALATFFGSIIWVFSSALIHLEADHRFLGRVFSTEMALLTLVMGLSNWSAGFAMDTLHITVHQTALWMAGLFVIPGALWGGFLLFVNSRFKRGECVGSVCPVDPSDSKIPPTSV
ncbi:MAG: MFS transporter [Nitrospinaceae bacterium]|nr:MFS transporter [Nitrospinaceae bacterium]NIR53576.1 MFS transporter [Nitrospinaceae bacterium]NIS83977.1 MFS transporter [Nitrospinaceae bacterium]NIT80786.1 MFS transporter [Nitrospinaceae bacterium]NIU43092.1 MFS transporter [Nitrospinaceae bacterium]